MNKETFLEELRGCLEVLEDQEQQDILEEYAQHIDIKIQNGQSEEDAIRDFGPLKELAAEILEAYHVKPEFGEGRGRKGLPGIGSVNLKAGEKKLRGFGTALRNGLAAAGKTEIYDCFHIERGYEDICRDLRLAGADIRWRRQEAKEKER